MKRFWEYSDGPRAQMAILLAFAFSVFFVKLWEGPLGGDEACYALLSREILRTGDWFVLHHPTVAEWANFYEHPPLYMWMTALSFETFGVNDFAAKVFSALTGFASVALVYFFGRRMVHHRFGLFAATMLTLTLYFVDYGRKARLENPLTFFLLLSFVAIVFALRDRRFFWAAMSGAAMGLGFLVKGMPAAASIAIAGIAVVFYDETWRRKLGHLAGFGLGALLVLVPWALIQLLLDEGRFFDWYVHRQVEWSLEGRPGSGSPTSRGLGGLLYYSEHLFLEIMVPWGFVGILGAIEVLRRRQWRRDHFLWIAIVGVLVVVGVFSAIPFRKARYVLPAVPFLALLGASFVDRRSWANAASMGTGRLLLFLLVGLLAVAATSRVPFYSKKDGDFLPFQQTIAATISADEPILVGGMSHYTVRQVFTWYFDRPQDIVDSAQEFRACWALGEHRIGIFQLPKDAPAPEFDGTFDRSGRYLLFVAEP